MSELLNHQRPPEGVSWREWLIVGGRGVGGTYATVEYAVNHMRDAGARARVCVLAPDPRSARDIFVEGESGLVTRFHEELTYNRSSRVITHDSGAMLVFGGRDDRAFHHRQWTLLCVDMLKLVGERVFNELRPLAGRVVSNTVPLTKEEIEREGRDWIKEYAHSPGVVYTSAAMSHNPHLAPRLVEGIASRYVQTGTAAQEVEGAWYSREQDEEVSRAEQG